MSISAEKVQFCINLVATGAVQRFAQRENIATTMALHEFMKTMTYDLLLENEAYLYLESPEYVLDMWDAERRGDWKRWKEI